MQELGKVPDQERPNGNAAHKGENKIRDDFEEINGQTNGLDQRFGRLVIGEGKSRYVASGFWASLSEQVRVFGDSVDNRNQLTRKIQLSRSRISKIY